ncbi:unnamed protein product [Symbiodinium natans]|uniref:RNase H type-1 domain-containing protein n=1 Tax=Symbiodinium natans TaxID=878477 RepID=A0A812V501_9DINO|nr:unnamed protein product [Symbiodinium natans]
MSGDEVLNLLTIIAKASGVLPRPATILDGEVFAISKALELCVGDLDITTDSRVAYRQKSARTVSARHSPSWRQSWEERHRAHLTWVKAHLDEKQFIQRFGDDSLWRWRLNQAADHLAGDRANKAVHPAAKAQILQVDTLVSTISQLLSHLQKRA